MRTAFKIHVVLGVLVLLTASLAGCSDRDSRAARQGNAASAEVSSEQSSEPADQVADPSRGQLLDAAAILREVDAEDEQTAGEEPVRQEREFVLCTMCGMKVPKTEAVFVEGKLLCAHCAPGAHGPGPDGKGDMDH